MTTDLTFNVLYHFLSQEEGKTLAQVKTGLVDELPFVLGNQKPFIDLTDKILAITKDDDYLENPAKQAKVCEYSKQIDKLVYKLYGLTNEEIGLIEGKPVLAFTDPNLQGKIIKASMTDLQTGQEYPLEEKPEGGGGKSRNLFFKPITVNIKGKLFTFEPRLHFGDKSIAKSKTKDPILDLQIYDEFHNEVKEIYKKLYKEDIHHTPKKKTDGLWFYDLSDKTIMINGENVSINYRFLLEMTKEQTITARARIK